MKGPIEIDGHRVCMLQSSEENEMAWIQSSIYCDMDVRLAIEDISYMRRARRKGLDARVNLEHG
jgi:hypothetical protein